VRVWDFFRRFLPSVELDHLEYAKGFELQERMPLWVKPTQKVRASLLTTYYLLLTTQKVGASLLTTYYLLLTTYYPEGGSLTAALPLTT